MMVLIIVTIEDLWGMSWLVSNDQLIERERERERGMEIMKDNSQLKHISLNLSSNNTNWKQHNSSIFPIFLHRWKHSVSKYVATIQSINTLETFIDKRFHKPLH